MFVIKYHMTTLFLITKLIYDLGLQHFSCRNRVDQKQTQVRARVIKQSESKKN